jgi:hypothetical protein
MRLLLLVIGVSVMSAVVSAGEKPCPFMNAATAGGILEGPVDFTMTKNGPDGTCEFTRRDSGAKLRIEVAAEVAKCTPPTEPLKAIGNEAVACTVDATSEQVVGRVRKQAFLIRVNGAFPPGKLRQKAVNAAELVAGNLF